MQLYNIEFKNDGYSIYVKEDEYDDFARAMALLSLEYTATVITEPMYAIHWYDNIDDEWIISWCTNENYNDTLAKILVADVEHEIETFNI
jgi:hypothetical protein